mmetsp:Transcript_5115/g.15386  ORF Transcript_5115/g.15386 Transcript_5115/m.15386 type:complete len:209 (-) Transcript_5115:28-654(-)
MTSSSSSSPRYSSSDSVSSSKTLLLQSPSASTPYLIVLVTFWLDLLILFLFSLQLYLLWLLSPALDGISDRSSVTGLALPRPAAALRAAYSLAAARARFTLSSLKCVFRFFSKPFIRSKGVRTPVLISLSLSVSRSLDLALRAELRPLPWNETFAFGLPLFPCFEATSLFFSFFSSFSLSASVAFSWAPATSPPSLASPKSSTISRTA